MLRRTCIWRTDIWTDFNDFDPLAPYTNAPLIGIALPIKRQNERNQGLGETLIGEYRLATKRTETV